VNRKKIAKALNISESTIKRVKKTMSQKRSLRRKTGSKAPRKLTKRHKLQIYRMVSINPFFSCSDIQDKLKLDVTVECIRLHLLKSGFRRKRPYSKLDLKKHHIEGRLSFAQDLQAYPFGSEIVFTDETSIWLNDNGHDGWFHCNSNHELSMDKHSGKVHAFGAINSMLGKVFLWTFRPYLKTPLMVEILRDGLLPQCDFFFPEGWVLAHDNGPQYTSNDTQYFLRHNGPIQLKWPSKSPDLNPIENVWGMLKNAVRKCHPQDIDSLEECVCNEWEKLDDFKIQNLCLSFPNRITKCIELHGSQVRY